MFWLLLGLLAVCALCSWLSPGDQLARSAARAFETSVLLLSQGGDGEARRTRTQTALRPASAQPLKTSAIRKRVTPLMCKRVAVRYGFRCGICGLPLDETWETDHITPLSSARTAADVERLNALENLQPVHRACHQLKSSREAAR